MIKILTAQSIAPFQIHIEFSDHSEGLFDASDYLAHHQGTLLEPLREVNYFNRYFIDAGALCWPNGLELSPQRLYELALTTAAA